MVILAILLSLVLFALSAIHVYWAFGGKWPGSTERDLVDTVIGIGDRMPPAVVSLAVALALALMAVMPLIAGGLLDDRPLKQLGLAEYLPWLMAAIAVIFLGRALGTLAFKLFPDIGKNHAQRFIELDRRFYGPLCLVLGLAYGGFYLLLS